MYVIIVSKEHSGGSDLVLLPPTFVGCHRRQCCSANHQCYKTNESMNTYLQAIKCPTAYPPAIKLTTTPQTTG